MQPIPLPPVYSGARSSSSRARHSEGENIVYPIYDHLLRVRAERGAGFLVLIDPDKLHQDELPPFVESCMEADVDALLVGGSLIHAAEMETYVRRIKAHAAIPVIGFPGSLHQLSPALDAVLFLSVISGRNPEYLFGQHVQAAPIIRRMGLEPISTGYMLVESGGTTTAQYMSHSLPLPRNKPEIAAATALAAEMMGMRLLYTDAGSGARRTVPEDMISAVSQSCRTPLVVGGGIGSPREVEHKVLAGASFIVVGNAIEQQKSSSYIRELAAAAHTASQLTPKPG